MNIRIISALAGSMFLITFLASLVVLVITPDSIWFRGALALLAVLALTLAASVLHSVKCFFNERREISSRILQEVRTHRAETRLARSEINEVADTVHSLLKSQPEQPQRVEELEPPKRDVLASDLMTAGSTAKQDVSNGEISAQLETELRQINFRLKKLHLNNEDALRETLQQSSVRTKQLVSILEAQRLELESLKHGFSVTHRI